MVRSLLLKGASTEVQDRKGMRPVDYIKEVENKGLQIELYQILVSFLFFIISILSLEQSRKVTMFHVENAN